MSNIDWPSLIGSHERVQRKIQELDREKVWRHESPAAAASRGEVAQLERRFGNLPLEFKEFLLHANGWRAFYQYADLFGTSQLLGSELAAAETLLFTVQGELTTTSRLVPIALTQAAHRDPALGADLFALVLAGPAIGQVLWFGGTELIDTFDGFAEFFVSMTQYGEREVGRLAKERESEGRRQRLE